MLFKNNKEHVLKLFLSLKLNKDRIFGKCAKRLYEEKEYFSKAFITSSIAESMNKLIRILIIFVTKGKKLTVHEFRLCFDKIYNFKKFYIQRSKSFYTY